MVTVTIAEKKYRLPNGLNDFQLGMYVHLINRKWATITEEPGEHRGIKYDAILPEHFLKEQEWPHIYPGVRDILRNHHSKNNFRIHLHFYHMASSQAANINLFLPILHHPSVNAILGNLRSDFASLATEQLDNGYCIEYWGGNFDDGKGDYGNKGPIGDKSPMAGTDSDIAIAYRNHQGELCLWLIEHKLTESEFTDCGGFRSKGRNARHNCSRTFSEIIADKDTCYYHDVCDYEYWNITEANRAFFAENEAYTKCPFKGGMNQLWRNQLLALAIENNSQQPYRQVTFSVVKHLKNTHLDKSLHAYKDLIASNPKFSVLTSSDVFAAATNVGDDCLNNWVSWYEAMYDL